MFMVFIYFKGGLEFFRSMNLVMGERFLLFGFVR